MKRLGWWCVSLVLVLALGACPPPRPQGCGGFICTEAERCEADTLTCVPNLPPEIGAIPPSMVVNTPTFVLAGLITDDESVTSAEWQVGSAAPVALTLGDEGAFTVTIDAPVLDSEDLVITLRARDVRSETTKDVAVKVDRVAPVLTLVRPDAGTLVGAAAVEVAVSATDGSGELAALSIAGQPVSMPRSGVDATQVISVPAALDGDPLPFVVTAVDPFGNQSTQTFSLVGDRVGPAVSFATPPANELISAATFDVEVDVTDPSPIVDVTVLFGGNTYVATEASAGKWRASVLTTVEEQDEVITVEVTDAAGNRTMQTRTVRVDRVAPTVAIAAPAAGSLQAGTFTVTVTTSMGTESVEAVFEGDMATLTGGPTLWTGALAPPQGRDFSPATLTVTARDLAGNSATAEAMVNVDNVAPMITFTAPAADQRFNASAFTTSQDVVVSWTVNDADPQAGTELVNGVASTALTLSVPTSPNDNPASYSTSVVARDRAGNTASATVSWSVDRRAPTVVSWTPANNARNVEPWQSVITFSERVSGPLSTSPALIITGQTAPTNDSWDTAHTTYTLPLDAFKSRVLDVAIAANVADDYGNPVTAAPRRFHLATGFASSTTTVATNVSQFEAASDNDGVVSVSVITTGNVLKVFTDTGGQFTELSVTQPTPPPTAVWMNSANVVSGATLASSPRLGVTAFSFPQVWRYQFLDGAQNGAPSTASRGAVVSRPPLPNEPSTNAFGTIEYDSYARGPMVRILSNPVSGTVAQSNDSWAAHSATSSQVLWSHYRCRASIDGMSHACASIGYGANTSSPTALQAAMTPNGTCLATTWTSGTTRQGVFQALSPCEPAGVCTDNLALGLTPSIPADLRVAPFGANGENTLLFSYVSGLNVRVAKMNQSCGIGSAPALGSVPLPSAHQPVRVGNHAGLLYLIGTTLNLRVF